MKGLVRRMLPCAFAVLCMAFAFASCGASGDAKYGGAAGDMAGDYETGAPDSAGEEEGTQERPLPQAGQLTAGEWNDNKNYEFFKSLFDKEIIAPQPDESGNVPDVLIYKENIFTPYAQDEVGGKDENAVVHHETWGMSPLRRVEVKVKGADGNPAAGASVALVAKGEASVGAYCAAKTDANGKAYLFPSLSVEEYDVIAGYGEDLTARAQADENGYTVTLTEESRAFTQLDLCFMIDTTGSMGDELGYLQAEVGDVISRVQTELPNADIRLGLVFYRDFGDEYVVKSFDFTSDISAQQTVLKKQKAAGGGDYPEAVHEALAETLGLSWREDARKILVPVLDAPPHDSTTEQGTKRDIRGEYGTLVYQAAEKGIAAVPVAASGVDVPTQYVLRSTALITGGTYVFLTDDSGIGNGHDKPVVGEFVVEYLNSCLVRVIGELYDGKERPAVPYAQEVKE